MYTTNRIHKDTERLTIQQNNNTQDKKKWIDPPGHTYSQGIGRYYGANPSIILPSTSMPLLPSTSRLIFAAHVIKNGKLWK